MSELASTVPGAAPADTPAEPLVAPTVSRAYQCQCGRPVFLRNSRCLACATPLGFVTEQFGVLPLAPVEGSERFTVFGDPQGPQYLRCANFLSASGCNWMVPAEAVEGEAPDPAAHGLLPGMCLACSTTRTIPDLSVPENPQRWNLLEQAKRRLISQLLALGLPVTTRVSDPVHGLAFDFLSEMPGLPVLTGHAGGTITLNVAEADDAVREQVRAQMGEPYRTLLGHFRHEIGHYYWDLLVAPREDWLTAFRELFGDEREDYAQALQQHYQEGPKPDWASSYISSYAAAHPWEDWAETWAHYLHMADTADTALSFGVNALKVEIADDDLFHSADLWQPDDPDAGHFLDFLNGWVRLTHVLNEFARSMGQHDTYPFALPHAVVRKLQFVHQLVTQRREP
ncbi:putative zinc-binding metallopeptidase [Variovorax sp. OV329]|uniref:zinc-binding metallopeptidase family protein n=1 Tax=Variovorax sp. OV329 TaxID=1882825 RepID=UPI0008E589F2|nr:putative zinc-binding metallopeptidase [Variovorax sp. OV329]SFM83185.1 hypothetical protein SAMN05444747_109141 [Variovorax sp. OV329]